MIFIVVLIFGIFRFRPGALAVLVVLVVIVTVFTTAILVLLFPGAAVCNQTTPFEPGRRFETSK